jgi:hypothetical protein
VLRWLWLALFFFLLHYLEVRTACGSGRIFQLTSRTRPLPQAVLTASVQWFACSIARISGYYRHLHAASSFM